MRRTAALLLLAFLASSAALARDYDREKEKEAEGLLRDGLGLMEAGKLEAALLKLAEARSILIEERIPTPPWAVQVPYNMARCEFHLGMAASDYSRVERARELLAEAQRVDERFGGTFFFWGIIGTETKNYRDAVLGFELALKRGWEVKRSRANLAQATFFYGVQRAREPHVGNEEVIRIFQHAVDRLEFLKDDLEDYTAKERANFRDLWIKSITNLAAMRQRANDLPEAETQLKRLIQLEPTNHLHHFNLGLVYGSSQKWDLAMRHYRKALELAKDPDWLAPLPMMGYIRSQEKRNEEAEKYFRTFLDRYPDHWRCNYLLANHYARTNRLDEAARVFVRCIELDRNLYSSMYKLSMVLRRQRKLAAADEWLALFQVLDEGESAAAEPAGTDRGEAGGSSPGPAKPPSGPGK